jgi:hypothetical protein
MNNHEESSDQEYSEFLVKFKQRFIQNLTSSTENYRPLFVTDADNLWEKYLEAIPESCRQHYNCNCCKNFVRKFGGLVLITDSYKTESAVWNEEDALPELKEATKVLKKTVEKAKIVGVFLSSEKFWGNEKTYLKNPIEKEYWTHMNLCPPKSMVYDHSPLTSNQAMAEKVEDFKNVKRAISEFSTDVLQQALTLLKTESLYRSEKVMGPAKWLMDLQVELKDLKHNKDNIIWKSVATAPAGFCHPRSSMIGTLLDDIASGLSFDDVSRKFAAKMSPIQYQRPQAAPSAGNIEQAEKIIEKLNCKDSLRRRFARLEELQLIWKPQYNEPKVLKEGVFSHLKPKEEPLPAVAGKDIPPIKMTWDKFCKTVLPEAIEISLKATYKSSYSALVTAVDLNAPPILQWDLPDQRNPFSWYVYHSGSTTSQWNLTNSLFDTFVKVTGITLQPNLWYGNFEHQGKGVFFVLENAKDLYKPSVCLFPEILKTKFHSIRSTIEAYSHSAKMEGFEEASACGLLLQAKTWNATIVKVKTKISEVLYLLDRWD